MGLKVYRVNIIASRITKHTCKIEQSSYIIRMPEEIRVNFERDFELFLMKLHPELDTIKVTLDELRL